LDQALDFFTRDRRKNAFSIEYAGDIRKIDQLIGTEIFRAAAAMWSA